MAYTNIDLPTEYFNTKLYTGDGGTQSVTGVGFAPDWSWLKCRSTAYNHRLYDTVRGALKNLQSNSTSAEITADNGLSAFNSDGFTVVQGGDEYNQSGQTYVSWNWKANGTGVSNTAGTITSTVSANTTAGFSIVSYTATSGASSIGHGLGVAPNMIILKARGQSSGWVTGFSVLGWNKYLEISDTDAVITDRRMFSPTAGTDPTSTLFWSDQSAIASAGTMIAYCFAEVKGYSKFGSYTGNNQTGDNGVFVYTGFKPAFLIVKCSSLGGTRWVIKDNKRNTTNVVANNLLAELANAENTDGNDYVDFLSNGFKYRGTTISENFNYAQTYIYMAFAESPIVSSKGIPTTAR